MKRTLEILFEKYPNVKDKINGENIPLTNVEDVFYQFALFIEDPEKYSFNLNMFYKYLQDEELVLGLHFIMNFFQKETFLIKNKGKACIFENVCKVEKLYNQTKFAEYLKEKGLKFTPNKLGTYYRRERNGETVGKFPLEDEMICDIPHWYESSVDLYARQQLKELKNKVLKKNKNK